MLAIDAWQIDGFGSLARESWAGCRANGSQPADRRDGDLVNAPDQYWQNRTV